MLDIILQQLTSLVTPSDSTKTSAVAFLAWAHTMNAEPRYHGKLRRNTKPSRNRVCPGKDTCCNTFALQKREIVRGLSANNHSLIESLSGCCAVKETSVIQKPIYLSEKYQNISPLILSLFCFNICEGFNI